ncbi:MAG: ATP-binding protein, partial [Terriglobales bacterium]
QEISSYIYESSQNLLSVLNELLDFSRLQAGKLALEHAQLTLQSVVDDVINSVQLSLSRKQLDLKVIMDKALPLSVFSDARRLKQVLLHLVQNALKFTEKGGIEIAVAVERKVENTAFIRFSVSDTGIGIDAEQVEHIFSPFVQADGSSTRKYGGVGLGLSSCKRLVRLLSGSMGATSEAGQGSTFWFTVPLECSEERSCGS